MTRGLSPESERVSRSGRLLGEYSPRISVEDRKGKVSAIESVRTPSVVLVIDSLRGGGAERQISQMANYWARKSWTVTLASWSSRDVPDFYELHPAVVRNHLNVWGNTRKRYPAPIAAGYSVWALVQLIRRRKPDVVLSFSEASNVLSVAACKLTLTRCIVANRQNPEFVMSSKRRWRVPVAIAYRNADKVVVQTKAAAEWMREKFGLRCHVIPNALRELATPTALRTKTIVCVGRLDEHKGHEILIRAFAAVRDTYRDWRLVIVGDGSIRQNLEALCRTLSVREAVDFAGVSSNVEAWMESAGIFVLPSRFEGFPNVLIEAMAMGAPVISTDCPNGPSEIITDSVDGRLVPVGDVDQLASAIADLIESPARREELGSRALQARARYHQDTIMSRWEEVVLATQSVRA
jgi:GalNAc-alpha-(1->4)-GalNAc-alpha-(1->3)-diNAcBac-PP-undecaprenol alpha-1,4-N-acetyl-D-galactosaminyltransferase